MQQSNSFGDVTDWTPSFWRYTRTAFPYIVFKSDRTKFIAGDCNMIPNSIRVILILISVTFAFQPCQQSAAQSAGTREVPARMLPVPDTASPQMQTIIARPFDPKFNLVPETVADWKSRVDNAAAATVAGLPKLR